MIKIFVVVIGENSERIGDFLVEESEGQIIDAIGFENVKEAYENIDTIIRAPDAFLIFNIEKEDESIFESLIERFSESRKVFVGGELGFWNKFCIEYVPEDTSLPYLIKYLFDEEEYPGKTEYLRKIDINKLKIPIPKFKIPPLNINPKQLFKKVGKENQEGLIIVVWSPGGSHKVETALNLAVASVGNGKDVALINYDFTYPVLDLWFDINQSTSEPNLKDAGVLTLGRDFQPEMVEKLLKKEKWQVKYLAAGNKLGNIGTPFDSDSVQLLREVIKEVRERVPFVIVAAGNDFEYAPTYAALTIADILVIPRTCNLQEDKMIRQILNELTRININKPVVDIVFQLAEYMKLPQAIGTMRLSVPADPEGYHVLSLKNEPYCLSKGGELWHSIVSEICIIPQ